MKQKHTNKQNKIGPTALFAPLTSRMESYMEEKVKEIAGVPNPSLSASRRRLQIILDEVIWRCYDFAQEGQVLASKNNVSVPKSFQRLFHNVNRYILFPLRELLNIPHANTVHYRLVKTR